MSDDEVRNLLDGLLEDEPRQPDVAGTVFDHADRLRKRRRRRTLIAFTVVVVLIALGGDRLTELLAPDKPAAPAGSAATVTPSVAVDPLLARVIDVLGPGAPTVRADERGEGWRRFSLSAGGVVVGMLELVRYSTTAGLCLPPTPEPARTCAPMPERDGVRLHGYTDTERRFAEVVAVREADARAYAVHAVGNGAADGPPLDVAALQRLARDRDLPDLFDPGEWCDRPDPSCPTLSVPAPAEPSASAEPSAVAEPSASVEASVAPSD